MVSRAPQPDKAGNQIVNKQTLSLRLVEAGLATCGVVQTRVIGNQRGLTL